MRSILPPRLPPCLPPRAPARAMFFLDEVKPRLAGETRCGGWARVTCLHRLVVVCGYRRVGFAGRATPRASLQRVGSAGSILRTARPLDSPIVRTRKPDATKRRDKCQKLACMVLLLRSEQGQKLIPTAVYRQAAVSRDPIANGAQQRCCCCKRSRTASPVKRGRGDTPAGRQQARASPVERQTRNDNGGGSSQCRWQHPRRRNRP